MTGDEKSDWQAITPATIDWHDQTPYAAAFADHYFSLQQGPAESRHVFIDGNALPQRFAALKPEEIFSIGETGFGSALNLLLTAQLFRQQASPQAFLQLISTELHPLTQDDLRQALQCWQAEVDDDLVAALLAQYPPPAAGFHRLQLASNISLTLALGDAASMLEKLCAGSSSCIDAWFLDGFAPARNPAMWSDRLCRQLARRSRAGTTLASYTVAGSVRRALSKAGFSISKHAGFGRKRECLRGAWPSSALSSAQSSACSRTSAAPNRLRRGLAAVVGAGLAGATSARALAERGWQVQVFDPNGIAHAASGNRVGVVYATPAATWSAQSRFYLHSYIVALRWLKRYRAEALDVAELKGVLQHIAHERQQIKLTQALARRIWPADLLQQVSQNTFELPAGGWVRPKAWCELLLRHPAITLQRQAVTGWQATDDSLQLQLGEDKLASADTVIVCTGASTLTLPGMQNMPLQVVRGQVTEVAATDASRHWQQVNCQAGYLTPAIDGVHSVGASYQPVADADEVAALIQSNPLISNVADDQYNLDTLRQHLPQHWQALGGDNIKLLPSRSGLRCRTADYLPLVGSLPDNDKIWLNTAHGSRGISSTPLCAELLADQLSGLTPAVDGGLVRSLSLNRYTK
jgi:tRNA 5-methylaminomethyl-2-thiouridine biosynthesis bifunctional protein